MHGIEAFSKFLKIQSNYMQEISDDNEDDKQRGKDYKEEESIKV